MLLPENSNFCSPQCAFAIIQPPMTQGQGEGQVKLHTMNLVAAGSPLTDMGFVCVFCSKYGGVSVTLSLSLTVSFLSFPVEKKKIPWDFGQFRGALGMGSGLMEDLWYLGHLHTR